MFLVLRDFSFQNRSSIEEMFASFEHFRLARLERLILGAEDGPPRVVGTGLSPVSVV
ncbi:hypothetical protein RRSWK_01542 [Rhodopirellula sp. SWK7]|nr:hypothetical protein RRSWK_01542 [Rhodopirellula sp. SWK7]